MNLDSTMYDVVFFSLLGVAIVWSVIGAYVEEKSKGEDGTHELRERRTNQTK